MYHRDIIAQMMRHRKIVGDDEERERKLFPNPPDQIDQFGLLHGIQPVSKSVTDQEFGSRKQGPRERRLLPLHRIKFKRIKIAHCLRKPAGDHHPLYPMVPFALSSPSVPDTQNLTK